jgi:DNA-binding FadR family transcriptional regulator
MDEPLRNVTFRPVAPSRGFEQVAEQIRAAILTEGFRPGDRLPPTRELAGSFRVSRALVNEALRVLEHSGLVVTRPGANGGTFVMRPAADQLTRQLDLLIRLNGVGLAALTEFRLSMEGQNAAWAAERATPADIARLEELAQRADTMTKDNYNPRVLEDVDVAMHIAIAKAAHNEFAEAIVRGMLPAVRAVIERLPERMMRPAERLPHVVATIKARDPEAARRAMQDHITFFARVLERETERAVDKPEDAGARG